MKFSRERLKIANSLLRKRFDLENVLLKIAQVAEAQRHILSKLNMPPLESLRHIKHKFSSVFKHDYESEVKA